MPPARRGEARFMSRVPLPQTIEAGPRSHSADTCQVAAGDEPGNRRQARVVLASDLQEMRVLVSCLVAIAVFLAGCGTATAPGAVGIERPQLLLVFPIMARDATRAPLCDAARGQCSAKA